MAADTAAWRAAESKTALPPPLPLQPGQARSERLARWTSNISNPPLLAVYGVSAAAAFSATPQTWLWGAEYLLIAVLLPTLYVAWLVRRGEVTDLHLRLRHQRTKPYLVALLCMFTACLVLQASSASKLMAQIAHVNLVQTLVLFIVTLRWKISAHCASAAALAVLGFMLMGVIALPLCAGVALVGWSRIRLRRHDIWQTVAGAGVGAITALTVLSL